MELPMRRIVLLLILICPVFGWSGVKPGDVLAEFRFGSHTVRITGDEYIDYYGKRKGRYSPPFAAKKARIVRLVLKRLAALEAGKAGLYRDAEFLKKRTRIRKRYLLSAFFKEKFPRDGSLKYRIKMLRLRHIVLRLDDSGKNKKQLKQMNMILQQLRKKEGRNFAQLAEKYCEDNTRKRGGILGLYPRYVSGYDSSFMEAAFRLKAGEFSGVVRSAYGLHIIKCDAVVMMTPEKFSGLFPVSKDRHKEMDRRRTFHRIWYSVVWNWINKTIQKSRDIQYRPEFIASGTEKKVFFRISSKRFSWSANAIRLRKAMHKASPRQLKFHGVYRSKGNKTPFTIDEMRQYHKWFISFPVLRYGAYLSGADRTEWYRKKVRRAERNILAVLFRQRKTYDRKELLRKYDVKFYYEKLK